MTERFLELDAKTAFLELFLSSAPPINYTKCQGRLEESPGPVPKLNPGPRKVTKRMVCQNDIRHDSSVVISKSIS